MSRIRERIQSVEAADLLPDAVRTRFAAKFFAVVLLIMVVTGSVGAYNYVSAKDTVENQVREQLVSTAELQADGLQEWISNMRLQTRTLSDAEPFQTTNDSEVGAYLDSKMATYPDEVVAMHFVDIESGTVVASSANGTAGTDLRSANVSWADDSLGYWLGDTSNVLVSSPYESVASDDRVVAFVTAVPGNDQYAVVVTATLAERAGSLHQTVDGGYTKVLNQDGETILASGGTDGNVIDQSVPVEDGADGRNTGFVSGEETVAAYAPVEGTNWVTVTYAPKSSAYAMRDAVGTSLLTTVLTAVVVLGVVSTLFGRRIARALRRLAGKADAMESGDLDVDLETSREDELGQLYAAFDGMRASIREQIGAAEDARETAEKAQSEAEKAQTEAERERREAEEAKRRAADLNDHLEAKADAYRDVMEDCAEGDLTRRMDEDARSEAMAEIARAFNEMLDEWEQTILRVRTFSDDVAAAGERATDNAGEVRGAAGQVSESVHEISESADAQDRRLQSAVAELNDLSATVQEISAATDEVARQADAAVETGEDGRESATQALAELDRIESDVESTVESVERLDAEIADIERVVGLITDIADQTHVLALNASIEAARATSEGSGGEGFGVVAQEVKALAEQTQEATDEIEDSIERVREQTETTVEDIRNAQTEVADGAETVETALDSLDDIVGAVEQTNDGLQEIRDATDTQADSTEETVAMVEDVASLSEQAAAGADDAASAAEQQTTALADVAEDIESVADRADRLRDLLDEFDVDVDQTVEREAVRADGGRFEYVENPVETDAEDA
ncbi:methyl-accepting chemotaxis protein [Halorussus halophilus]|uniref:methyl-accepting chemotaxis protein n=1 Tax=Halorussus halophilus TaxID=2650975 RepID=UPI00130113DB|nr:methyl-accepting chemotaxis protein [Halorussus halophilus]